MHQLGRDGQIANARGGRAEACGREHDRQRSNTLTTGFEQVGRGVGCGRDAIPCELGKLAVDGAQVVVEDGSHLVQPLGCAATRTFCGVAKQSNCDGRRVRRFLQNDLKTYGGNPLPGQAGKSKARVRPNSTGSPR
jgi:hypothetical protein